MKILTAAQIREVDKYTIENEPVPSIDLMERAAAAFVNTFISYFPKKYTIKIFCGIGNNGGDGLVIARLLQQRHYKVKVFIVRYSEKTSEDFAVNFERLKKRDIPFHNIHENDTLPDIKENDIVIDAMWGSGLSRPIEGFAVNVIDHINNSEAIVVAVDIPSGVFADKKTEGTAIHANLTISFQLPKLAFFFRDNYKYIGIWDITDIGLNPKYIDSLGTNYFFVDVEQIAAIYHPREKFTHKGTYGHALFIGGSYGKIGAAVLSTTACLDTGAGMVTAYLPRCGYEIMQIALPEAMVLTDRHEEIITDIDFEEDKFDVMGIGPGLGTAAETQQAFHLLLKKWREPMVIDADGLNILSKNREWLKDVPENSILTPHPKEFERLAGKAENDFEQMEKALKFARENNIFLILKGSHSFTATPEGKVYFNPEGNPGMGTAGSGDVLTGMLTGLLAQGYSTEETCILGVYLHALAGNIAANNKSMESMTSMDILNKIPDAFNAITDEF